MKTISRRQFLKTTASASAAVCAALPLYVPAQVMGANNKIQVALVGAGGHGTSVHVPNYLASEIAQLSVVCDVDLARANAIAKLVSKKSKREVAAVQDARTLLDDKNIDVISIATCNHWHALLGIWACQAGKHAYIEKPVGHTMKEGRKLMETAEKYGLCMQHGTHRRNFIEWYQTVGAFRSGKYGKPLAVHAFTFRPREGLGFRPVMDPPASLDWNLWTGPAEMTPFHLNLQPYNWHWFWNTGNGEIGNTGVHYLDLCRLGLGDPEKHPSNVRSFGARIVKDAGRNYQDQAETPTVQLATYDFDGFPCIFEAVSIPCSLTPCRTTWYHTEDGYLTDGKFYPKNGSGPIPLDFQDFTPPNPGGWFGNFLNCVHENTPEKLNAPMKVAHYSTALCHIANISQRLGKPASWEECTAGMGANSILQERMEKVFKSIQEYLPDLDLRKNFQFTLGEVMNIDNQSEQFPGNDAANAMLSKVGRAPFTIPETV